MRVKEPQHIEWATGGCLWSFFTERTFMIGMTGMEKRCPVHSLHLFLVWTTSPFSQLVLRFLYYSFLPCSSSVRSSTSLRNNGLRVGALLLQASRRTDPPTPPWCQIMESKHFELMTPESPSGLLFNCVIKDS